MSMLAEKKSKQRWTLNPRGNLWSSDSSKFGQKMLEKMGWSQGKGLGARENGITESIKVSYKNDSKGMGFKENNELWTEHSSNFNSLLKSLTIGETERREIKSLEAKSQSSRVRVHYKKFTRGKDLSRYSEKDLANIFGKKTLAPIISEKSEETEQEVKPDNFSFNGGSIVDYFKSKMNNLSKHNGEETTVKKAKKNRSSENQDSGLSNPGFDPLSVEVAVEKHNLSVIEEDLKEDEIEQELSIENKSIRVGTPKKKKNRRKSLNNQEDSDQSMVDISGSIQDTEVSKKKKQKRRSQEESRHSLSVIEEEPLREESLVEDMDVENSIELEVKSLSDIVDPESAKKKKKKVKKQPEEEHSNPSFIFQVENNELSLETSPKKSDKKIRKKQQKESTENGFNNPGFDPQFNSQNNTESENIQSTPSQKKKRKNTSDMGEIETEKVSKKRKKEKAFYALDNPNFDDSLTDLSQDISVMGSGSKKKPKKSNLALDNPSFIESEEASSSQVTGIDFEVKRKKKRKHLAIDNPTFEENYTESMENSDASSFHDSLNAEPKNKKKKKQQLALENPSFVEGEEASSSLVNGSDFEVKRKKKKNKTNVALDNPAFEEKTQTITAQPSEEISFDLVLNVTSTPAILKTDKTPKVARRKSVRFNAITQERIIPNRNEERNNLNDLFNINNQVIDKANSRESAISRKFDEAQALVENDLNESKANKAAAANGSDENTTMAVLKYKKLAFAKVPHYQMKNKSRAKSSYKHLLKGDVLVCFNNTNFEAIKGYGTN